MPASVPPPTPTPGIFGSLFQASKAHLSPLARACTSFLEILILTVVYSAVAAIGDYTTGHPGDIAGLIPYLVAGVSIAVGKAFTAFAPQLLALQQQAQGVVEPSAPTAPAADVPQASPVSAAVGAAAPVPPPPPPPPAA